MAFSINSDCICCGSCEGTCPVSAISQGSEYFEINPETCIECGSCADACPTGAIKQA
ncbi:MAG: 4Fe-4S binding protein [Oscillospiraceae bacterium]|nr:4Fe-4S binding protein [Oscillospiraceae bacterium]MCD7948241.1 4Fe-4S binding protein [Oscillospiraceae bacterium]